MDGAIAPDQWTSRPWPQTSAMGDPYLSSIRPTISVPAPQRLANTHGNRSYGHPIAAASARSRSRLDVRSVDFMSPRQTRPTIAAQTPKRYISAVGGDRMDMSRPPELVGTRRLVAARVRERRSAGHRADFPTSDRAQQRKWNCVRSARREDMRRGRRGQHRARDLDDPTSEPRYNGSGRLSGY